MAPLLKIFKQIEQKSSYKFIPPIPALLKQLEDERIKEVLVSKLDIIEEEIKKLLNLIKGCKTFEETQGYFDILQKTQESLARLFFKEKIIVSDSLEKFIRDFDRVDDDRLRTDMFSALKNNEYSW